MLFSIGGVFYITVLQAEIPQNNNWKVDFMTLLEAQQKAQYYYNKW